MGWAQPPALPDAARALARNSISSVASADARGFFKNRADPGQKQQTARPGMRRQSPPHQHSGERQDPADGKTAFLQKQPSRGNSHLTEEGILLPSAVLASAINGSRQISSEGFHLGVRLSLENPALCSRQSGIGFTATAIPLFSRLRDILIIRKAPFTAASCKICPVHPAAPFQNRFRLSHGWTTGGFDIAPTASL